MTQSALQQGGRVVIHDLRLQFELVVGGLRQIVDRPVAPFGVPGGRSMGLLGNRSTYDVDVDR